LTLPDGLLNDIKAKGCQNQTRLYCEINAFLSEIEEAKKKKARIRKLRP
jgi:hypothetical protein